MPYFPEIVVLDTGSVDGTRQLLEHLAGECPRLKVYDAKFEGYAQSRTTANGYVKTKYSLILDADEILPAEAKLIKEVEIAKEIANANKAKKYIALRFNCLEINPTGEVNFRDFNIFNPRLFPKDLVRFERRVWEWLTWKDTTVDLKVFQRTVETPFLHFVPNQRDYGSKKREWYEPLWDLENERVSATVLEAVPSSLGSFKHWKCPNPSVLQMYGIDLSTTLSELHSLGLEPNSGIMELIRQHFSGNRKERRETA